MKIAVIGNGTMGAGIVQCAAQHNMDIIMKGRSKESLDKAMLKLKKNFARLVEKGKITEEQSAQYYAHIKATQDFADIADADLIIEALSEDMEVKKATLRNLDGIIKPEAIFATNTSSLSITELA